MMPAMKIRQSGFTTVELLTTLLVAGILTAMAVPSFSRFVASSHVIEQTNDLVAAVNLGRSEAIRRNVRIRLCRASTNVATTCATGSGTWRNWILLPPGGEVLRRGEFNDYGNTQFVSSTLDDDTIDFTPDGLASTGGVLVNAGGDAGGSEDHFFLICSSKYSHENIRRLTLGASSRVTTTRESGSCA